MVAIELFTHKKHWSSLVCENCYPNLQVMQNSQLSSLFISTISREMLKAMLLLQLALYALSEAQPQPPPMANTFQGSGEVELHDGAGKTFFGKCNLPTRL